jgi:hypothetical protein
VTEEAHERAVLAAERALQAAMLASDRTWIADGDAWRVIAAHIAPVAS